MNTYCEGFHLSADEIVAVMLLGGKRNFFAFQSTDIQTITPQRLCAACCQLIESGLMTQIDSTYRLRTDLMETMIPIRDAKRILLLTPSKPELPQIIYYIAEEITAAEPAAIGGFSLYLIEEDGLSLSIQEHLQLEFSKTGLPELAGLLISQSDLSVRTGELTENEDFLIEAMNAQTGKRYDWARGFYLGLEPWLEWTEQGMIQCCTLTQDHWEKMLEYLLKEDSE